MESECKTKVIQISDSLEYLSEVVDLFNDFLISSGFQQKVMLEMTAEQASRFIKGEGCKCVLTEKDAWEEPKPNIADRQSEFLRFNQR